jgi:glycosyltransferase involved in cell wall biosynthesis
MHGTISEDREKSTDRVAPVSPTSELRVLFVEVAYGGLGADYSVHAQLVEALAPSGELAVMSLSHPGLAASRPDDGYRVPCRAFEFEGNVVRRRASAFTDMPLALRRALPAIRQFEPHVVYSSQLRRDALAAHTVSVATKVPHILHLHYNFGPWLGRVTTRIAHRARHVITVSEYVRQSALLRGMPEDRVTTVPNLTSIRPVVGPDRSTLRAELGITDDEVVVIAVGRLDGQKGYLELVDAVAAARCSSQPFRVLICGAPGYNAGDAEAIQLRVGEHRLDDVVQFLGHRSDIPALLNASDVFCLPAKMEGFGLVYIEAMRAGLPVVALRSGGVPEIVVDEVTGLLSYPGDSHQLAHNLRSLIEDRRMREDMGRAGVSRLETHFDNAAISRRWIDVVTSALRSS